MLTDGAHEQVPLAPDAAVVDAANAIKPFVGVQRGSAQMQMQMQMRFRSATAPRQENRSLAAQAPARPVVIIIESGACRSPEWAIRRRPFGLRPTNDAIQLCRSLCR
ncbi:hypothetical protein [Streptomyces olivochromogenes]|uniref:hypothetical protein n=1 Tax=Streptomyces olivochromogenes TaxID=1963 RepID=UPI003689B721